MRPTPSFVVVIATFNRPHELTRCLEHALRQVPPSSVYVVDASPGRGSEAAVGEFEGVSYLYNPQGLGHLAGSRRLGMAATESDVIIFLDDDVLIRPGYVSALLRHYEDPKVGGVGGRLVHGRAGEDLPTDEPIGRFRPDSTLTGGFTVNTGEAIEVDHLMGATMTYRRAALEAVGGIRDIYPGTCLREDSDNSLRLSTAGWTLLFEPGAVADHIPAAYAKGERFDARYTYYAARNHLVLMTSVFGLRSPQFVAALRFVFGAMVLGGMIRALRVTRERPAKQLRRAASGVRHALASLRGGLAGLAAAVRYAAAGRLGVSGKKRTD